MGIIIKVVSLVCNTLTTIEKEHMLHRLRSFVVTHDHGRMPRDFIKYKGHLKGIIICVDNNTKSINTIIIAAEEYKIMLRTFLISLFTGIVCNNYVDILNNLRLAVEYIMTVPHTADTRRNAYCKFKEVLEAVKEGNELCLFNLYIF